MRGIKVKNDSSLSCLICNKKFKYLSAKKRHELSHSARFECNVCHKEFSFLSALRRHEKQHERTGSVKCAKCKGRFRDDTLLKRHIKYAHKGTFSCPECLSTFSSDAALKIHLKIHKPKSERRYRCSFDGCDKTFNFSHHLKHHELTHTDKKQYSCDTCGKGFIQLHHLKSHLRTHEPDNCFPCTVSGCSRKYCSKDALRKHLVKHMSEQVKGLSNKSQHGDNTHNLFIELDGKIKEKSAKGSYLCSSCGEMVSKTKIGAHASKCAINTDECSTPDSPLNLSYIEAYTELSILENKSNHDKECKEDDFNEMILDSCSLYEIADKQTEPNIEIELVANQNDDREFIDYLNDCKSVLGGCLMTGSSEIDDNCICSQISSKPEPLVLSSVQSEIVQRLQSVNEKTEPKNNNVLDVNSNDDNNNNECKGCDCVSRSQTKEDKIIPAVIPNKYSKYTDMPKIQVRLDGVIKIEETFDIDIETINKDSFKKFQGKQNKVKKPSEITVPYNSCKDILGNCIVSGNDSIGEGCICARMAMETQQATAEEIDEISICPVDDWIS